MIDQDFVSENDNIRICCHDHFNVVQSISIINMLPYCIFWRDLTYKIVGGNQKFCAMVKEHLSLYREVFNDDARFVMESGFKHVNSRGGSYDAVFLLCGKKYKYIESGLHHEGVTLGTISTMVEIT